MNLDEMAKLDAYPYCYDLTGILGGRCNNPRSKAVSVITPHHAAGTVKTRESVENICRMWKLRGASTNYFIDMQGEIYLTVAESNRSWASSNSDNDAKAITFEMSNSQNKYPWAISDATYNAAVTLSAYACKKYGIIPNYNGTKSASITTHRMFAATQCPGDFFIDTYLKSGIFVADIKKLLSASDNVQSEIAPNECYIQIGAYKKQLNAIKQAATLDGYSVYPYDGVFYVRRYVNSLEKENALEVARAKYPKAFAKEI